MDVEDDATFFQHIFAASPTAMLVTDTRGVIVAVNHSLQTLTCCSTESLLGSLISRFCSPVSQTQDPPTILPDAKDWDGDVHWEASPNLPLTLALNIRALPGGQCFLYALQTKSVGCSGEGNNEQAEKLKSLGVLAGSVAHDLNNILTGVLGHVSYLRVSAGAGISSHAQSVTAIEDGARRAAALTQQILDFARGHEIALGSVNLSLVVAAAINLLRLALPSNVAVNFTSPVEDIFVRGHESQLTQLVMNLTINAKEALPAGGTISITLSKVFLRQGKECGGHSLEPGSYASLSIADNGVGICSELREKIFEPFFTTKNLQGTGLGLSTVRSIIFSHGGLIELTSAEKEGTRFDIYLVLAEESVAQAEAGKGRVTLPGGTEHILVVDDEEAVRTVIQRSLEHLGYTVVVANGGKEALETFAREPSRFSLVIMDMIMPHMSGDDLFYRLRALDDSVCVLIASGYSSDNRTKAILASGALGFIQKPFAVDELAEEVRRCIDKC